MLCVLQVARTQGFGQTRKKREEAPEDPDRRGRRGKRLPRIRTDEEKEGRGSRGFGQTRKRLPNKSEIKMGIQIV